MSFKEWCKRNIDLTPISSSIERGLKEHKDRVERARAEVERKRAEKAARPKPEDPEDALFASMSKRRDDEIVREKRRYKTQAIRKLANQILVQKSLSLDLRNDRFSGRDGQEALECAQRIYELTENYTLPEHPPQ